MGVETSPDSLSDLPGHSLLAARLSQQLADAGGPQGDVAVIAINVDRFQVINHRFGLGAADGLLLEVARRVSGCLRREDTVGRPQDTFARIGGDEFAVLLGGVSTQADALAVAQRIREALAVPVSVAGEDVSITVCYGVALRGQKGDGAEALMQHARIALGRAKEKGPDSVHVFEAGVDASEERRLRLENELREAVGRHQLELNWQPIVSLTDGHVFTVEALLRWQHPELGTMSPLEFLGVAEQSGLILSIGRWVLHEACRQTQQWRLRIPGGGRLRCAVNVSAKQLQQAHFHESVQEVLNETGLEPDGLELEVTEGLLMRPSVDMRRLHRLGVGLSIDDFGTGNLSFSYLARLPVSAVKIDAGVVAGLGRDPEAATIVSAMLATAKSFQLATIGEGIETSEQLTILRGLGCSHGQGYRLTRPLGCADLETLLCETSLRLPLD